MLIHFKKDFDNNFTLHCVRVDGTETFHKYKTGSFQIEHDLMHFVVEKRLGYTKAFYGIVASGKDIDWFAERTPAGKSQGKEVMRGEAEAVELIVGTLQTLRNDTEFFDHLNRITTPENRDLLSITQEQVIVVRKEVSNLLDQWQNSKEGITLVF